MLYEVITDNPFVNTPGAEPSIWSYGHRNPQSLAIHPETGALWSAEHGPFGGDELNLIKEGANYGWPVVITSYSIHYTKLYETPRDAFHPDWVDETTQ